MKIFMNGSILECGNNFDLSIDEALDFNNESSDKLKWRFNMNYENFKEMVLKEYRKGNIVFLSLDNPQVAELNNFINQPADGILHDLNRSEEVILTYMENPKWVNDYAVAKVIRALKEKIKKLGGNYEGI